MDDQPTCSATIGAIAAALAKAQMTMNPARESEHADIPTKSGRMQYGYATLADVIAAVRQPLSENGIAFTQRFMPTDRGQVWIVTQLIHESGEWVASHMRMNVPSDDARVLGSAITYGCRYALRAICGLAIVGEDDDGAAASANVDTDYTPLADHPPEAAYLLAKAETLFGRGEGEGVLTSLAIRRFRIADGDWRLIPKNRMAYAIQALEKKAESPAA
jgi:hypothetical protein